MQGDAFKYISLSVIHIEAKSGDWPWFNCDPTFHLRQVTSDQPDLREILSADFRLAMLSSFLTTLRPLITYASSELRKIKQRQQDLVLANAGRTGVEHRLALCLSLHQQNIQISCSPRHTFFTYSLACCILHFPRNVQFRSGVLVRRPSDDVPRNP